LPKEKPAKPFVEARDTINIYLRIMVVGLGKEKVDCTNIF
jgi:hypothetical protein